MSPPTIAVTLDATYGYVLVTISAGTATRLRRIDVNGARDVRLFTAGDTRIFDFEPSLSGQVEYRADYTDGETGQVSAWVAFPPDMLPRFTLPHLPNHNLSVESVYQYSADRSLRTVIHDIIGRTDPLVVQGELSTRRGALTIWQRDYVSARFLEALFAKGIPVHYRQCEHPGMDMYFQPTGYSIQHHTPQGARTRWGVNVAYIETAYPIGEASYNETTYNDIKAANVDYNAVADSYENYLDLQNGDKI